MGGCHYYILSLALATAAHGGGILYVDDDAVAEGDGAGWATAYRFLQDALAEAEINGAITRIHVAQGVYTPDRDELNPDGVTDCCTPHGGLGCDNAPCEALVCAALPPCCLIGWDEACAAVAADLCGATCSDPRHATFQLVNAVKLLGGYAGQGAVNPDDLDPVVFVTILSGDLSGNDGPGPFDNNGENAYHVVSGGGVNGSAELEGFTITAGNGNGTPGFPDYDSGGAGMLNNGGSPTINNCIFSGNSADGGGAAMQNREQASPAITACRFVGNVVPGSSGVAGAILNVVQSGPSIDNCVFDSNSAAFGGAIHNTASSHPIITNCVFMNNIADLGGAIRNFESSPAISDCTFTGNAATTAGGAVFNHDSIAMITDCSFIENTAVVGGGAVLNTALSNPTLTGCDFTRNDAEFGGAMRNVPGSPKLIACTFNSNAATAGGGALFNQDGSAPKITECTFIANTAAINGAGIRNLFDASPTIVSCRFVNNTADNNGGGMASEIGCAPTVFNSLFLGNHAGNLGGGVSSGGDTNSTYINCTFKGNSSTFGAGGISTTSNKDGPSVTAVTNSIVWGNTFTQIVDVNGAVTTVRYSDIQGGWNGPGTAILDVDPECDAEGRLTPGSPVIDAGDNTAVPPDTCDLDSDNDVVEPLPLDLDGNPRFADDVCATDTGCPADDAPYVDMGAFEFQGCSCDIDGDDRVGIGDFLALLAAWGPCDDCDDCPADLDGDCAVGITDFLRLLANWGC